MPADAAERPAAPALLRGVAFAIDAMLAMMTVFAAGLLVPGARAGLWQAAQPLFGVRDAGAVVLLLLVRDVVAASPGKWLLCLRLERPNGRPLPFAARLRRLPLSLLPVALAPRGLQSRLGWRVRTYVPSRTGLALRTAFTASAAMISITWAVTTLRPSITSGEAERLASALVQGDAPMRRTLGEPVRFEVRGVARRGQQTEPGTSRFGLRLRGTRARQDMQVHARRVNGAWVIEELSDIEITAADDGPDVAER